VVLLAGISRGFIGKSSDLVGYPGDWNFKCFMENYGNIIIMDIHLIGFATKQCQKAPMETGG